MNSGSGSVKHSVFSCILISYSLLSHSALPNSINFSLAPILESKMPGIVNIKTAGTIKVNINPWLNDPFFQRFFPSRKQERKISNIGSGVIVNAKKGYVVTNQHVINDAQEITVTLIDGKNYKATLIGQDVETDLALLKIKAKNLTAIKYADSEKLRVGDFVIAIGNPFGLDHTVTSGIISALERSAAATGLGGPYKSFIQTDASINPGNSGGALITLQGTLAGINSSILSKSGGNIGIGFAVPSNLVKRIVNQLSINGQVRRGILGVNAQSLNPDLAKAFNLHPDTKGAVITETHPDSSAKRAGLKTGDVITHINHKTKIVDATQLIAKYGSLAINTSATLTVIRNNRKLYVRVAVSDHNTTSFISGASLHNKLKGAKIGVVSNLTISEDNSANTSFQVTITDLANGSPAAKLGLKEDDVFININQVIISNLKELKSYFKKLSALKVLKILIKRKNRYLSLIIRL